uniref:Non-specific serine/threonine protein kinase n=1 Tax=Fagus sylvatica TaxID=28930 RepID=A0A2N9EYP4_FAGSY
MDNKKNPWPMLYVFFICLSLNNHLSLGADTISANQSLSGDQTVASKGGNFELGFFKPVWSTNLSFTSSGPVQAVLQDDGNLVLKDGSNSSKPFWQSFDNPAHTWLPGAKIAYNNKTNDKANVLFHGIILRNPAPGLFSLELQENSSSYIILWNKSQQYWTSGYWNGHNFQFDSAADMVGSLPSSGICFGLNRDHNGFQPTSDNSWNLSDYSGGCKRKTSLQCGNASLANGKRDKFLEMPNMKVPLQAQSVAVGSSSECESTCLNNCACTAYAYDKGCSIWIGDLLNLRQLTSDDSSGGTLYLKLAASELPSSRNNKAITAGVIAGSVAGITVLVGLIAFFVFRRRKGGIGTAKAVEGSLVAFGYRDLQNATKNFSDKLGGGGFGSVFKGTLPDSTVIAVKKLEGISQGEKQFRTEVSTIGTIQHVNLVRLRGFCSEGIRKLLVYDYMPNGSLDSHLFHEKKTGVLDWKTRYQIILGTARGLVYLHEKCRDCIIHCDIKPENILLDAELCPKVADFGLAKLMGREFSRVLTTMRGTRGYLAPEWISGVAITTKADVYSYGMMLFELVSGRRNSEQSADGKTSFFPTWAASLIAQGRRCP